jgi:hypothetical protein
VGLRVGLDGMANEKIPSLLLPGNEPVNRMINSRKPQPAPLNSASTRFKSRQTYRVFLRRIFSVFFNSFRRMP